MSTSDLLEQLKSRYPSNAVLVDGRGNPSVMVFVPMFRLCDVIEGARDVPHPAFVVNGRTLSGIYVSKFQNVVRDGDACSLPDEDPATHVDFDTACRVCTEKGDGWHLLTAMEWGAIALWCAANGWLPYGNNELGKDFREDTYHARISYCNDGTGVCRTATGSGPVEWSHNRREDGIYDLNANVWEWVGGMRLVRGEVQVLYDNCAVSVSATQTASSAAWRAIDGVTGELVEPDANGMTPNSIKLDFIDEKWTFVTGAVTSQVKQYRFCDFGDVCVSDSVCDVGKELLQALALLPPHQAFNAQGVSFYANNGALERIPFRGGRWGQGENAGVFKTCLDDPRTYSGDAVGFRSAYYAE